MSETLADIVRQAFDDVAEDLDAVIQAATLSRATPNGYDARTDTPQVLRDSTNCRLVFARADAGKKYFPELTIAHPEDVAFIEGAQAMPPREQDVITLPSGVQLLVLHGRDILQVGGLWAVVVRPI